MVLYICTWELHIRINNELIAAIFVGMFAVEACGLFAHRRARGWCVEW